ncbi:MAG TPA: PAS domain S-box protein, partial [Candidatus Elarobacter sp.]|nr:PAS domain S-box protein [Candidatus Elarobacter sp.]
MRVVVDAAPIATVVVDDTGRIVSANAQAGELFGYAPADLLSMDVDALVPVRFRGGHGALRGGFFGAPTSRPMGAGRDLFGLRNDGAEVPIEIGLKPIETEQGLFVLAAIIDLTERKRAEEHQRLIIEAANAMIMVDGHGKIAFVNTQAEQLFGYDRYELLDKSVETLVPERLRGGHPSLRSAFLGDPTARPMGAGRELFGLRKDGSEVPIEIGLNPLTTPEGQFVIAAIIDITERRRVEELRIMNVGMRQHNEQLAALNAELESFSYSVSHDLRAPVRAISGYARALEEDYGDRLDAEAHRLLSVVGAESARMGRLIDALLEFSRIGREPIKNEPVSMSSLAREVVERAADGARVAVDDLPDVRGDVTLLRQVCE